MNAYILLVDYLLNVVAYQIAIGRFIDCWDLMALTVHQGCIVTWLRGRPFIKELLPKCCSVYVDDLCFFSLNFKNRLHYCGYLS